MEHDELIMGDIKRNEVLSKPTTFKLADKSFNHLEKEMIERKSGNVEATYTWGVAYRTTIPAADLPKDYRIDFNNIIGGVVLSLGEKVTEMAIIKALREYAGIGVEYLEIRQLVKRQVYNVSFRGGIIKYETPECEQIIDNRTFDPRSI